MGGTQTIYRRSEGRGNGRGKALRLCRRLTAFVTLSVAVLYFVMAGTSLALKLGWIEKIQIIPVALTVAGSMIIFWAAMTLLFGRVYCSMVCPAGIIQDIAARLPRLGKQQAGRRGYRYREAYNSFRYLWLVVIVVSAMAGLSLLLALFDPYCAFGRIMTYLLRPLIVAASGGEVVVGTAVGIAVAVVTLIVLVAVAIKRGRLLCNTLCPVGAALSLLSRHSVYGMDINTDMCVNCGLCEQVCKVECINAKGHTVDMSRCVVCFNCTAVCESGAISYTRRKHRLSIPMLMRLPGTRVTATIDAPSSGVVSNVSPTASKPATKVADRC